jgi:excisionase family DNA binding protein
MEFYTRNEVAKYFRVHERTIDRWIESGSLKGYKFGDGKTATLRIPKAEVEKFLEDHRSDKKQDGKNKTTK